MIMLNTAEILAAPEFKATCGTTKKCGSTSVDAGSVKNPVAYGKAEEEMDDTFLFCASESQ
jgi:hypothetical protein